MRRHLSYANVAATLALVFAMTGGALAAKHYLINSTRQINPKVLKKLRGNAGKTGPKGVQGAQGLQGVTGGQGPEGRLGPSNVFSSFHEAAITLESLSGQQTFSSLPNIPPGSFWVLATFDAVNATGAATVDLACELHAGVDVDIKQFRLQPEGPTAANNMAVALQVVHSFAGPGNTVTLSCNTFGVKPIEVRHIRITALQSAAIANTGV
jgi:hypothetical protein